MFGVAAHVSTVGGVGRDRGDPQRLNQFSNETLLVVMAIGIEITHVLST
jgi:hypothetical protein